MTPRALTIFVCLLGSLTANSVQASDKTNDDLPMTERFTQSITDYRDCVIVQSRAMADDATSTDVGAAAALSACSDAREIALAQLASDIRDARPTVTTEDALMAAERGMAIVDPMVADVVSGQASAQEAPVPLASDAPWTMG